MKNLLITLFEVALLLQFTHFLFRMLLRKFLTGSFKKKTDCLTISKVFLEYVDIALSMLDAKAKAIYCKQEERNRELTIVLQDMKETAEKEGYNASDFEDVKINSK